MMAGIYDRAGYVELRPAWVIAPAIAFNLSECDQLAHAPVEILITNAALGQGLITLYRAGRIAGGEQQFRKLYLRATRRSMEAFLTEKPQ